MSLNIGNVLKVVESGKWIKVPAKAGIFYLKLKQLIAGEQYAFKKKRKEFADDEQKLQALTDATIASHILGWKELIASDKSEIAFTPDLLKDKTFMNSLLALTVEDGRFLSEWIVFTINKSDVFTEAEDPDFLANI